MAGNLNDLSKRAINDFKRSTLSDDHMRTNRSPRKLAVLPINKDHPTPRNRFYWTPADLGIGVLKWAKRD
ncbi:MAG: hypothetical protein J2P37_13055, partial [Ktedonobacteraceae bacterium]|nr:hypothetical protein [Ktedonobacteraceae bacterium]